MRSSSTPPPEAPRVLVIGGGIAGLAAAARLLGVLGGGDDAGTGTGTGAGADGPVVRPHVTLLDEADRFGGKLRPGEVGGIAVDLGAESMLARRPEAVELARSAGLGPELEPPTTAKAAIWTRGALRPMPTGHVMGVPGDLDALAATGVISPEGMRRIRADLSAPATEVGEDVAIGEYVAARVGREVVDRLVDPLLGGVYAGHADRISMRAAVPQLLPVAQRERSLVEGVRGILARAAQSSAAAPGTPPAPVFQGVRGGLGRLPGAVAEACREAGGELRTGTGVKELRRTPDGWRAVTTGGEELSADAVVLAVPAAAAARLLAAEAPAAAGELGAVEYASMALVTLVFQRSALGAGGAGGAGAAGAGAGGTGGAGAADGVPPGSGFLVPPVDGRRIKAATFSSNKWGWLAESAPDSFVLRTSFGRHGEAEALELPDEELVAAALGDLREAAGIHAFPYASTVTRWYGGLPQYPAGHLDRVARIRELARKLPDLALCGAAYDGVGIPACVGSGRRAADDVLSGLSRHPRTERTTER
jgi:oxygen-dependent protoporphyrinogen oxidase